MFIRASLFFILLSFFLIPLGCSSGGRSSADQKTELMVSAAASLTDALSELKASFESKYPGVILTFNFGGSGKLATQIEQGAPSDVFLSASKKDMDRLEKNNLIQSGSRIDFAENVLVLITHKESPFQLSSFEGIDPAKIGHFAIGDPGSVPVGRYTKEVLENLKLWGPLESKFVLGSDVRQVLTYVESGNADIGVVYSSDAMISDQVKVIATANPEWHQPIVYPGAITSHSTHSVEAKLFMEYLTSEQGQEIFSKYGFK